MDRSYLEHIETGLRSAIESRELAPPIDEAARYAVLGGGKRLRPILTLQSCVLAGGTPADALPAAVSLELIHAFSLIHDDLPALDDDDIRRGRPTVHRAFNQTTAILTGDSLQCIAAEVALESPRNASSILSEILSASRLMIDGQSYDTEGVFRPDMIQEESRLRLIHRLKTSALIQAACRCGALAAEADQKVFDHLDRFGAAVGLMFQIVDDVLDETQTTEHLGKTSGKDRDAGKRTFPGIIGLEQSRAEITRLAESARDELKSMDGDADPLRELVDFLAFRTN